MAIRKYPFSARFGWVNDRYGLSWQLNLGGSEQMCGWLKDRYGLSWQIVPTRPGELLSDPDPEESQRVMKAMLQMVMLDVQALEEAYEQA